MLVGREFGLYRGTVWDWPVDVGHSVQPEASPIARGDDIYHERTWFCAYW